MQTQHTHTLFYVLPGEGNGNPLQYSCRENPMDGGAWWAAVHGVAKSQTRLSDFTLTLAFFKKIIFQFTHLFNFSIYSCIYS